MGLHAGDESKEQPFGGIAVFAQARCQVIHELISQCSS